MLSIAFVFESASGIRAIIVLGLSTLYLGMPFIRGCDHNRWTWSVIIDAMLLVLLTYYSKYNINYLYMMLFFWNLYEVVLWRDFEKSIYYAIVNFIGIFICFKMLFEYGVNYQLFSQTIFLTIIYLLFTGMLLFYKFYIQSKKEATQLNQILSDQNESLLGANHALESSKEALEHANLEVARLTRLKERSELAKTLHDSVGHEITGHIMALEMLKMQVHSKSQDEIYEDVQHAIDQSRDILRALRILVNDHKEIISHHNFYDQLSQKMHQFQVNSGITIYIKYQLFDEVLSNEMSEALYHIVLESVSNSAKHGVAKKIWVSFQTLDEKFLLVKIMDNGVVEGSLIEGNGLRFIRNRVEKLAGSVEFQWDLSGFRTTIKLPYYTEYLEEKR